MIGFYIEYYLSITLFELWELLSLMTGDWNILSFLSRKIKKNYNNFIINKFVNTWYKCFGYYEPHIFYHIYFKFYLKKRYKIHFCEDYEIRYTTYYTVRPYYQYVYIWSADLYIMSFLIYDDLKFICTLYYYNTRCSINTKIFNFFYNVWLILHYSNKVFNAFVIDIQEHLWDYGLGGSFVFIMEYFGYYTINTYDHLRDRFKYTLMSNFWHRIVLCRVLWKYTVPYLKKIFNKYAYSIYFWYRSILLCIVIPKVLKLAFAFIIAPNIFSFHPQIELYYNTNIWGNTYGIFFRKINHFFFKRLPQKTLDLYDMSSAYFIEKSLDLKLHFEHLWFQLYLFYETDYYQDYDTHEAIRLYIKLSSFFTSHIAYWNTYTCILHIYAICFYYLLFIYFKLIFVGCYVFNFIDYYIDMPYIRFSTNNYLNFDKFIIYADYVFYYMSCQIYHYCSNSLDFFKYFFNINRDLSITFNQIHFLSYWGEFTKDESSIPWDWYIFSEHGTRNLANTSLLCSFPAEINLFFTNYNTTDCIDVHLRLLILAKRLVNASLYTILFIKSW